MKLTELYESETGEKSMYRKDSSDYHTLRYVRWLENQVPQQSNTADRDTRVLSPEIVKQITSKLKWGKEINEKYLKDCKSVNQLEEVENER